MTWKSSSEQSFKLTGIALMIVKVSRGMERGEIRSVLSSAYRLRGQQRERVCVAEIIINFNRTQPTTHNPQPALEPAIIAMFVG